MNSTEVKNGENEAGSEIDVLLVMVQREAKDEVETSRLKRSSISLDVQLREKVEVMLKESVEHFDAATEIFECLYKAVKSNMSSRENDNCTFAQMNLVGSTANKLCLCKHSDVDIVLMVKSNMVEGDEIWCTDVSLVELVFTMVRKASEASGFTFVEQVIRNVKVPVLKLRHTETNKEVIISIYYLPYII